MSILTYLLI